MEEANTTQVASTPAAAPPPPPAPRDDSNGVRKGPTGAHAPLFKQSGAAASVTAAVAASSATPAPSASAEAVAASDDPAPTEAPATEVAPTPADAVAEEPAPPAVDPALARKADRQERLAGLRALADATRQRNAAALAAGRAKTEYEQRQNSLQQERDSAAKRLAEAEKDPLAWLASKCITARQIAERIAKGEEPNKELQQLVERAIASEENAKKLVEEARKRDEEARQREQQAEAVRRQASARAELARIYDDQKAKYPTLHARITGGQPELLWELTEFHRWLCSDLNRNTDVRAAAQADAYSIEELLEGLETRFVKRYGAISGKPDIAARGPTTQSTDGKTATPTRPKSPTLTTRQASEVVVPSKDFHRLSEDEKQKQLVALYRAKKSAATSA